MINNAIVWRTELSITSYDVLPQDDTCERCKKRIGSHDKAELWKCLQFSSLCIKQVKYNVKSWTKEG